MKKFCLLLLGILSPIFFIPTQIKAMPKPKWKGYEKCAGITRKKKNDCGANGHSCAGHAKKDRDKNEWIYTPKGLCKKIAGGKIIK